MIRRTLAAALLACALTTPAVPAAEGPAEGKDRFPPFQPLEIKLTEGERLTYEIKWGAVDAGEAVLSVKRKVQPLPGKPEVWNVQCETRSNSFVSMFYEVRDDIKTLIDAKEGFSRSFDIKKNEGSYHGSEQIEFDYDRNLANYTRISKGTLSDKIRRKDIPIPGKVSDPLSCLYYIRGLDLKPGSESQLTVNTDRKNWVLTLKVLGSEKLDLKGLGRFNALVVEPEAQFQGLFVRKGKMTVWLDEKTRIPLKMKVDIPIGSATATLVKAEDSALALDSGKRK